MSNNIIFDSQETSESVHILADNAPVTPEDAVFIFPISFAQQRLWFMEQLEPGSGIYNIPVALRLRGELKVEALEKSLNEIKRRHESLRTTFRVIGAEVKQVIEAEAKPERLAVIDLSQMSEEARSEEMERLMEEEAREGFDLQEGPVWRKKVVRLGEKEHVLLLTMHHIISDGWSMGVMVKEVGEMYRAEVRGEEAGLEELRLQYGDYAEWERERMKGEVLEREMKYWEKQLGGELGVMEMGVKGGRPEVQRYEGKRVRMSIGREESEGIRRMSRKEGATVYMVMMAAFKALMYRYSGQKDVIVGSPIANRNRREIEGLIGFFVNTLAMRTEVRGEESFRELVARVKEVTLGAYEHQEVPFEKLVEAVHPERDLSRTPIFQVMFTLQNAAQTTIELPGLKVDYLRTDLIILPFDLAVLVSEEDDEFIASFCYDLQLYDSGFIERMAEHYRNVLESVVSDQGQRIGDLPLMGEEEVKRQLEEWNETSKEFDREVLIHEAVEARAAASPQAVAIAAAGQTVTYEELNKRTNQLAQYLRKQGVGPEQKVAILLERSKEMVEAQLGVMKAGGAYVAMDASTPASRVEFMVKDAGAGVVISERRIVKGLEVEGVKVVCVEEEEEEIRRQSEERVESGVRGRNLAYVIYTSGSTGRPKGVGIEHGSLMNLVRWHVDEYEIGGEDRATVLAGTGFDASVWEIWPYLSEGARLEIVPEEVRGTGEGLMKWMGEHEVTMSYVPTVMAEEMMQRVEEKEWSRLRVMLTGGERLRVRPEEGVRYRVVNHYGPTESTVVTTRSEVEREGEGLPGIGRPIANTRVYILDERMRAVPIGVVGEIWIGGEGLARGYVGRAEQTAERFVPDPHAKRAGERMYRTGDLGRYGEEGEIEYVGRVDEQVKVRGYRIELGEIEAVMGEQEGVKECAVVARGEGSERRLVGYVVAGEGGRVEEGEIKKRMKERVPEYMVPGRIVVIERLPLTANGKLDRRALPEVEKYDGSKKEGYEAPRTEIEKELAEIVRELLGVERVGIHDNFFELGGHSLLATQLVSRIRQRLNVEVPLKKVFEEQNVGDLAAQIYKRLNTSRQVELSQINRASRKDPLPLSFAQQRLWFLDKFEPNNPFYNIPAGISLEGDLNIQALQNSINEIIRRHEALRTTFNIIEGEAAQVIHHASLLNIPLIELSELRQDQRQQELEYLSNQEARRGFDLSQGPVIRIALIKLGDREHLALVNMHHIVSDGWSVGVMIKEVAALYEAFIQGKPSPLEDLSIQYADYALWQRDWLEGDVLAAEMAFWREQLKDAPALLDLPTDRPRPAVRTYNGDTKVVHIGKQLTEAIKGLSRKEGATVYMVMMAAFKALMYRYSGQKDVIVGSPIANRNRREIEGLIGFFVNTLAMRTEVRGEESFRELVARVKEVTLGAYEHQEVPFEKLVEAVHPERDLSRTPIFQVMFTLQNMPVEEMELPGVKMRVMEYDNKTAVYDMTISLMEREGEVRGYWEYNTDLYERETIERMLGHYVRIIEKVVEEPEVRIDEIEMMGEQERRLLLSTWNLTDSEYPSDRCVHELFEAVSISNPNAIAVKSESQQLSYGELNYRANQLARYLQAIGVKPETKVVLCLDRSIELLVGSLGVLKAGGAYVSLDPAYPPQRLTFMINDSQSSIVLTKRSLNLEIDSEAAQVIYLDADWKEIAQCDGSSVHSSVCSKNLAYVIYTSGSTGRPKGVGIEHGSLMNLVRWHVDEYEIGEEDRATVLAGTGFDASVWEIWPYLSEGARLEIVPEEVRGTGEGLMKWMGEHEVTMSYVPTVMAEEMMQRVEEKEWSRLRVMLTGGERLRVRPEEGVRYRVVNHYGPTESTVVTTRSEVGREGEGLPGIGRPIANTRVYILDERMRAVPIGVVGEIWIGGEGLARGYVGRAEQTAERFVPDPHAKRAGERMYRTGDLGRYGEEGEIEYVGRVDEQVKVRGYRIELGEIEAVMGEQEGVKECAVVARGEGSERRLVGYVVAGEGERVEEGEIKKRMKERVPEYMVPGRIVVIERLPLTANGKVDKKGLPEVKNRREGAVEEVKTAVEEIVAGIWKEVLKIEEVRAEDNLFEIGGHSLLATRVLTRIREVMGVEVGVKEMFEEATVRGLGRRIEEKRRRGEGKAEREIKRVERVEGGLRVSFAQQRLWFLEQLQPGTSQFHMMFPVRFEGNLKVEALEKSLNEIKRRHESLRTTFRVIGAEVKQVIEAEAKPERLAVIDLSQMSEEARSEEMGRLMEEEAREGFDLQEGPVWRKKVVRLGEREHVLLLTMHHIISDGWSMGVMVREVGEMYRAEVRGEEAGLEELRLQYGDYAEWERERMKGEVLEREMKYWEKQLGGELGVMEMGVKGGRPEVQRYEGKRVRMSIGREESEGIKRMSRKEGATVYMVMLAAFKALMYRYSGQKDIIIGSLIANRSHEEAERLIGLFLNTLAMRTEVRGEESFRELVARVKEVTLGAYEHQEVPFEKLVEAVHPERDLSRTPIFQVMFTLQNMPVEEMELPGVKMRVMEYDNKTAVYDMTVSLMEREGEVRGYWEYNTDLYERETIERMLGHYVRIIEKVVEEPEVRIDEIEMMGEQERRLLLSTWNLTDSNCRLDSCFHELFEEQAARTPNAEAVVFEQDRLSYLELNARANQLARILVAQGVGPDSLVALLAHRSTQLLVSILAVFKAGGAYIPLDPLHPPQRIGQILRQSEVGLVLSVGEFMPVIGEALSESASGHSVSVLNLEETLYEDADADNLPPRSTPDNLAYVIYTSGSTGVPKGAMVEQKGMVNHLHAKISALGLNNRDTVAQTASQCFDISVWQFLSPLMVGGRVVILNDEVTHDPARIIDKVSYQEISILEVVPSLLRALIEEVNAREAFPNLSTTLRWMIATGEALPPGLARSWFDVYPQIPMMNAYGPTECSDDVTHYLFSEPPSYETVQMPIGQPIENIRMYVLDKKLAPVPVGVSGELCVGGVGVGRGYLNDVVKTVEAFIPDPFGSSPGARLYKTGDLVRYRKDGNIEYISRKDYQVKIRGFRIELEEIESVLAQHPAVREAAVVAREDAQGEKHLAAYMVVDVDGVEGQESDTECNADKVSQWQMVFESIYQHGSRIEDSTLNLSGWNSSYTGEPIPHEQMREWVESSVERILEQKPSRVMEIGCGTGMLLLRIAPHCKTYCGTDFAPESLRYLRQQLDSSEQEMPEITLLHRGGDNFEAIANDSFDGVILNSVVQYFPSIDYLLRVLEGAINAVEPGGFIYLGDIRSLPLLEMFHVSVEMSKAETGLTKSELRQRVQLQMSKEQELLIDPAFFHVLKQRYPKIGDVTVQIKRGHNENELTRFRYDVVLRIGAKAGAEADQDQKWLDWREQGLSRDAVRKMLIENEPDRLCIKCVPNTRIEDEVKMLEWLHDEAMPETVGQMREVLQNAQDFGVPPEHLWQFGYDLPYSVSISGAAYGAQGCYDVVFSRSSAGGRIAGVPVVPEYRAKIERCQAWYHYANNPLQEIFASKLLPRLRSYLKEKLPEYMVPSSFITLDAMPLTQNGKIDRRALPAPSSFAASTDSAIVEPRTQTEQVVAEIWHQILDARSISVRDKFFDVGGDSLKLIRAFRLLSRHYSDKLTVVDLFKHNTIESLSDYIDSTILADEPDVCVQGFEL